MSDPEGPEEEEAKNMEKPIFTLQQGVISPIMSTWLQLQRRPRNKEGDVTQENEGEEKGSEGEEKKREQIWVKLRRQQREVDKEENGREYCRVVPESEVEYLQ